MSFIDEVKMAITSPDNLSDTIKAHKHSLLASDQLATSVERSPARPPAPPFEIDDAIFTTGGCPCGYEEGRSEADRLNHKENCLADGDRAWDSFRDNATDAEMAEFVKEQDELYRDSFDMTDMGQEEL